MEPMDQGVVVVVHQVAMGDEVYVGADAFWEVRLTRLPVVVLVVVYLLPEYDDVAGYDARG